MRPFSLNWRDDEEAYANLAIYLLVGGLGLAFLPSLTLRLFLSTGDYGDIMPRVAGMLMIGLSGLIAQFVYYQDYRYYAYSVYIRSFFVLFLFFLFARPSDPLFLVLNAIVLIGLLPSIYTLIRERARPEGWFLERIWLPSRPMAVACSITIPRLEKCPRSGVHC